MEIRTRKVIRRYVSSDSGGQRKRPKVFDRDEYYYRRHAQQRRSEERHSPTHRIIETREPLRSRASLNTLWRRDSSPIRSQPFKMRLPYIKRVTPATDYYESRPRGRTRSSRPFVVDPAPEIRYAWPKSERPRPLSPEIRCISPRRKPSLRRPSPRPLERERERTVVVDAIPREGRSLERPKGPRPPRARTPVIEREPVRRRQRAVEIHQSPERRQERSRSIGGRQVRFAEDINYEEYRNRPRGRKEYYLPECDDDGRDEIRRRLCGRRVPNDRPRYRHLSPDRTTYRKIYLSGPSERGHLRPRIIQDGNHGFSEASNRIYAESQRRGQERDFHNLVSHSNPRRIRRFDDIRDCSSEDDKAGNDPSFRCPDVFDIHPEKALELLCITIEKLEAMSTVSKLRDREHNAPAGGADTPTTVTELHVYTQGRDLMQQSVLSKRFLSKREPEIPPSEYVSRLHRYCPLSTGVYLATSLYLTRIVNVDRIISVNRKNMHRLVLAGLRVAMKTVEDLPYPHSLFAKVGGVTERELTRLEISFCFLADFELRVDEQMLAEQAKILQWHLTQQT
ncbi:cyclin-domain-containing protein [Aspergillus aurantiobrunneus]